jgi:HK97 family phage major capsid protein
MDLVPPNVELPLMALWLARSRGDVLQALRLAEAAPVGQRSDRVTTVLRAAVSAGTMSGADWAAPLAGLTTMSTEFLNTLRPVSFAILLSSVWRKVPLAVRVLSNSAIMIGGLTGEAKVKPAGAFTLKDGALQPKKATAFIVVSDEAIRSADAAGVAFLSAELKVAVASALDEAVTGLLRLGLTPIPAAGITPTDVLTALRSALGAVSQGAQSRLVGACSPTTAAGLAALNANGVPVFPELDYRGGTMLGIQVVAIGEVPGGELLIVDGARVAGALMQVELDASQQATLRLDTSAADPAAADIVQSLWQANNIGLRGESWFGVELVDPAAAVVISGLEWP